MNFTQQTFLGASISNFACQVGWNEQSSQLTVSLVEDVHNGDNFDPPIVGSPVYFEYDGFSYGGLLQSYVENNSEGGNPVYTVSIVSPTEVLAGTQLIIGGYNAETYLVPNLLNVYGFWESLGFGTAQVNDAGMPAYLIMDALTRLTGFGATNAYGRPLRLRGYVYTLEMGYMPSVPSYYRIGGTNLSVLDFISQVCSDFGHDFYVELVKKYTPAGEIVNVIQMRAVSRRSQPDLNAISTFINSNPEVNANEIGREFRNEICSSYIVGGNKTDLLVMQDNNDPEYLSRTISPFWGTDSNGNFIQSTGSGDNTSFQLDARAIDVLGVNSTYDMTVAEMRAALVGEDEWESYLTVFKPAVATQIGIEGAFKPNSTTLQQIFTNQQRGIPLDFLNTSSNRMITAGNKTTDARLLNIQRLYNYVKSYAENFYGRKYAINVPFNLGVRRIPDTNEIVFDMEPTDGGYLPDGSAPLGLSVYNEDLFQLEDGRFGGFARYDNASGLDFTNLDPSTYVVEGDSLFVKCNTIQQIFFSDWSTGANPRVVLDVPGDVYLKEDPNNVGFPWSKLLVRLSEQIANNNLNSGELALIRDTADGVGGINSFAGYFPNIVHPSYVAVPMKSNVETYGPWYKIGAYGKTNFIQDQSLVPWNFGGYDGLNLAANAKVYESITFMQEGEMGSIRVPGTPTVGLGEVLLDGGPNVTYISCDIGVDGVITTYQFRTYTPQYGTMSKVTSERIRQLGSFYQQNKRTIKQQSHFSLPNDPTYYNSRATALITQRKDIRAASPHEVLFAEVVDDPEDSTKKRTVMTTSKISEALSYMKTPAVSSEINRVIVGFESVLRPYRLGDEGSNLSKFGEKSGYNLQWLPPVNDASGTSHYENNQQLYTNADTFNPFKRNHDIELIYRSDGDDLSIKKSNQTQDAYASQKMKGVALKTPIVITGPGYDIEGLPVPRDSQYSQTHLTNYLKRPDTWKTGPLDVRWNDNTGMWNAISPTFPSIFEGRITAFQDQSTITVEFVTPTVPVSGEVAGRKIVINARNPVGWPIGVGNQALVSYTGSNLDQDGDFVIVSTYLPPSAISLVCDVSCDQTTGELVVTRKEVFSYYLTGGCSG